MSSDAIVMLKQDHKEIRSLFRRFEKASEDATATRGRLVDRMIELLTVHTYLENECMYPEVWRLVPELEQDVLESYEEHHVAEVLTAELAVMRPGNDRFQAKTTVLIENVTHHMDEEEQDWFPKVRKALGRKQLADIGAQMAEMRKHAPHKPSDPRAIKKAIDSVTA